MSRKSAIRIDPETSRKLLRYHHSKNYNIDKHNHLLLNYPKWLVDHTVENRPESRLIIRMIGTYDDLDHHLLHYEVRDSLAEFRFQMLNGENQELGRSSITERAKRWYCSMFEKIFRRV